MKEEIKSFALAYADLMLLASKLVMNMNRDSAEFAARGIDAAKITDFEALGDAFEVFPPDDIYLGEVKDATTAKNILRETVTGEIQLISGFFEQQWGTNSGKYSSLRVKGFHKKTDAEFLFTARVVVEQATKYLADLTDAGLTQALIDTLEADGQLFEDAIIDMINKKELRDTKANERVIKSNELYDYVTKYSRIGKLIWENVDESKYNDYIIYHTPPSIPSKVQNLSWDEPSTTISWDSANLATGYELLYSASATPESWNPAYLGGNTSVVFNPGAGDWNFRCRGINDSGSGAWSDVLEVEIIV